MGAGAENKAMRNLEKIATKTTEPASEAPLFTLSYAGVSPQFATPPVLVGAGAAVLGRATLGRNARLGAQSVIRADGHFVKIGDDFSLGPRSTVHIAHDIFPAIVGDRVTVGENAVVHACTLGSDVVVGDGAVILDGSVVADNVVIEPRSIVFPRSELQSGKLYAGMPARPVRDLRPGEIDGARRKPPRRDRERRLHRRLRLPKATSIQASSWRRRRGFAAASSRRERQHLVRLRSRREWRRDRHQRELERPGQHGDPLPAGHALLDRRRTPRSATT